MVQDKEPVLANRHDRYGCYPYSDVIDNYCPPDQNTWKEESCHDRSAVPQVWDFTEGVAKIAFGSTIGVESITS